MDLRSADRCAVRERPPAARQPGVPWWLRRSAAEQRARGWLAGPVLELRQAAALSGQQAADRRSVPSAWKAVRLVARSAPEREQPLAACVRAEQPQAAAHASAQLRAVAWALAQRQAAL
jgi:hypothetical protein